MLFIRVLPLQAVGPRRLHCDWAGPFSVLSLAAGPEWRTNGVASSLSTSRPRTLALLRLAQFYPFPVEVASCSAKKPHTFQFSFIQNASFCPSIRRDDCLGRRAYS
jgi:hypothetical protein